MGCPEPLFPSKVRVSRVFIPRTQLKRAERSMREAAKDGHTRRENVATQPLKEHRVFNNPDVVTEGGIPSARAASLSRVRPTRS